MTNQGRIYLEIYILGQIKDVYIEIYVLGQIKNLKKIYLISLVDILLNILKFKDKFLTI